MIDAQYVYALSYVRVSVCARNARFYIVRKTAVTTLMQDEWHERTHEELARAIFQKLKVLFAAR